MLWRFPRKDNIFQYISPKTSKQRIRGDGGTEDSLIAHSSNLQLLKCFFNSKMGFLQAGPGLNERINIDLSHSGVYYLSLGHLFIIC